jgi:hypothetical protein
VLTLAATAASEPIADPARRFAVASGRVLRRAAEDATWGRVALRLVQRPGLHQNVDRYLREDLAEGLSQGRFDVGPEDAAVDQAMGLLVMTMWRIVEGTAQLDAAERAVGVDTAEAAKLAADALAE